jgi:hypothetical protein
MKKRTKFIDWMKQNLDRELVSDIVTCGCNSGISGLIYWGELNDAYDECVDDLWEVMSEIASDFGHKGALSYIAASKPDIGTDHELKGFIVWCAAEYLAQTVLDEMPEEEEVDE